MTPGLPHLSPADVDRLLALSAFLVAGGEALAERHGGPPVAYGLVLAALASTVLLRRSAPAAGAAGWALFAVLITTRFANPAEASASFLVLLLLAYAAGRHATGRQAWLVLAVLVFGSTVMYATFADAVIGDFVFPPLIIAGVIGLGRFVRSRAQLGAELHEAALQAEEARDRATALAEADERRRIAREMHDVVAHSVSVMVIQAGGARRILATDSERAAEAAAMIEHTGREALAEMRRLLGVIGGDADGALAPAPGLDRLDSLLNRARGAGLEVHLQVDGAARPLPVGLDLAAYRIVQEALTNVLRHTGGSRVRVALRWGDSALDLEVEDDGALTDGSPSTAAGLGSGGHGLLGMQERARLYGGTLTAEPRPQGGFRLHAVLPTAEPALVR